LLWIGSPSKIKYQKEIYLSMDLEKILRTTKEDLIEESRFPPNSMKE
jgi:hypothetical protein